jgi:hypothetical protein
MGNPVPKKTYLEVEAYALLFFLQFWKESTKKEAPTICSQNNTPWILSLTMEQVKYKIMEPFLLLAAQYLT